MPTFTPEQLKNMTLDELERYYNLDPNNLDVCHAYIELQKVNIAELEADVCRLEAEVDSEYD